MKADKAKIMRLLKTAKGQIDGVIKMIENDKYCVDIANQIMAGNAVLKKAAKDVLHAHISFCVADSFENGSKEEKSRKINEVMTVIDKMSK